MNNKRVIIPRHGNHQKSIKSIKYPHPIKTTHKVKELSLYKKYLISIFTIENIKISSCILSFLEYKDILSLKKMSKSFNSFLKNHKVMKQYVLYGSLSQSERMLFYITNLNIKEIQKAVSKELIEYNINKNYYKNILKLAIEKDSKDKNFHKVIDEINKDLHRTFFTDKFKNGNGQSMLNNVLSAIAFIRPEIGYCQGMNFIGGALVNLVNNEEKCFWIFLSFIDNIQLNLLYLKNMPDFLIRIYQLKYFIEFYFPKLCLHFRRNQINLDIFFSKWLLTLFSNYLSFDVLYKVWDIFIIDKWKALFKFCMIFLNLMKDELMKMDLPKFCNYFRDSEYLATLSFNEIIKYYNYYKITNSKLKILREDYFIDQVKIKLDNPNTVWESDQKELVNRYYNELDYQVDSMKESFEEIENNIKKMSKDCNIKYEKVEKQQEIVTELKIKLEEMKEVKTGHENVLKRINDIKPNNKKQGEDGLFNSVFNYFSGENSESSKIQKKIRDINKKIEEVNKEVENNSELLDKYQKDLDVCREEKNIMETQLEKMNNLLNETKRELLKNLSEKLKLSAKFVATNKY